MLVIKLIDNVKESKFKFFKKKKRQEVSKKESFVCCNEVFTIIEVSEKNLCSAELKGLLNRYSGAVIFPEKLENDEKIQRYKFDSSSYFSRAYLSATTVFFKANSEDKLCVYIDNFRFCREWLELAALCRAIVIMGAVNADLKRFCGFCKTELGLVPQINDGALLTQDYVSVNLNNINVAEGFIVLSKNEKELVLYPDTEYFKENESVKKLIEIGIAKNTACAAVQVVPFKKIYINRP